MLLWRGIDYGIRGGLGWERLTARCPWPSHRADNLNRRKGTGDPRNADRSVRSIGQTQPFVYLEHAPTASERRVQRGIARRVERCRGVPG